MGEWLGFKRVTGLRGGLWSEEIPASDGVVGRSSWASVSIGSVTNFDVLITSPCWSQVNVVITVA